MKRFIRRLKTTWHLYWFRYYVDHQLFEKAALRARLLRESYGFKWINR